MEPLSAGIMAGASIIGGLLGNRSRRKAETKSLKETKRNNAWSRDFAERQFHQQILDRNQDRADIHFQRADDWERTKFLARNSAGWQFDDLMQSADEAGIHRLAALGSASATSYSGAVHTGSTVGGLGADLSTPNLEGQDYSFLGDAVGAYLGQQQQQRENDRADKLTDAQVGVLNAERRQLDASTSRTAIANARAAARNGPAKLSTEMQDGDVHIPTQLYEPDRVPKGPNKGDYLVTIGKKTYLFDKRNTPVEQLEMLVGTVGSELAGVQLTAELASRRAVRNHNGDWVLASEDKGRRSAQSSKRIREMDLPKTPPIWQGGR